MAIDCRVNKYALHPDFIGTDIGNVNQRGGSGDGLLHIVTRRGEVSDLEVLVSHGADVNSRGDLENTPLHNAALAGQLDYAERLLAMGADPTLVNIFGQTPFDVALLGNQIKIAKRLRKVLSLPKNPKKRSGG